MQTTLMTFKEALGRFAEKWRARRGEEANPPL
jgi:hypothetical protein